MMTPSFMTGEGGEGKDHSLLTNLTTGDPHTQYLLTAGTRDGTGAWRNLASLTARIDAVGTGTDDGLVSENTTAAAAGAQQYSPLVRRRANGWKTDATAASQAVEFADQVRPVQGAAAPTGALHWLSQIDGGGWTSRMNLDSAGVLTVSGDTDTTHVFGRNKIGSTGGDRASFSHFDSTGSTIGITQHSGGNNFILELNTASNGEVRLQTAGTDFFNGTTAVSKVLNALSRSNATGITASTTQTQAGGTALTKDNNNITVCANANDAATMPTAVAGAIVLVMNNGAQTLQLFPFSGDNFQGVATDASTTIAAGAMRTFVAISTTVWISGPAIVMAST